MSTRTQQHRVAWPIHSVMIALLFLLLLGAALIIDYGVRPAIAAAGTATPVQLIAISTTDGDHATQTFHQGQQVGLVSVTYNRTADWQLVTIHPAVYKGTYKLYNYAGKVNLPPGPGTLPATRFVAIPKDAPLGTYIYYFTLSVKGYSDQSLKTTFTVVK